MGQSDLIIKANTDGDVSHLSAVGSVHIPAALVKVFDGATGRVLNERPAA
jgi:multiple sugar transport system ATP-binding protein